VPAAVNLSNPGLSVSDKRYQIHVEVQTRFLPDQSDPESNQFAFAYTIRITNTGTVASQLISRHWLIRDEDGRLIEVKGLGVVGHQPLLEPGQSFEYTSGSQIASPTGAMRGSYFFVAEDGHRFDAPIDEFALSMPRTLH
jgi:ApaG protein